MILHYNRAALNPPLPGSRDEGLRSQEGEQHDEGADQVGVEHLIPHLGELDKEKDPAPPCSQRDVRSTPPPPARQSPTHLFLDVGVLEDQGECSDVLPVHSLAAPHLDGMLDALVDLLGGGLPNVGQRAICK